MSASYLEPFSAESADVPFLTYYGIDSAKAIVVQRFTRGEFHLLGRKAANLLRANGLARGDTHTHYFTDNRVEDLAFRLASVLLGTVPVTVNWQADTPERVVYKVSSTGSRCMVVDAGVPPEQVQMVRDAMGGSFSVLDAAALLPSAEPLPSEVSLPAVDSAGTRIVIFTSGTTGNPKGVSLPYRAYETNRATFESFLQVPAGSIEQLREAPGFAAVVTNPMHHTNSTAITDWALRRPFAQLHLMQRYTTQYWQVLACAAANVAYPPADPAGLAAAAAARAAAGCRVVAPLVSRHFDFLDELCGSGKLPVDGAVFRSTLSAASAGGTPLVTLLLGSAPVGPTTVERLLKHCGVLPTVRFGSTETCLQVAGTPLVAPGAADAVAPFERGWAHVYNGVPTKGYYIGRPHPPHTEAMVVKSVTRGEAGYLQPCAPGEPGQLVCRGGFLMSGYVGDEAATAKAIHAESGGWYVNLGDVCFALEPTGGAEGGALDLYWLSRDSALLIKGGANYSYEQINAELSKFAAEHYGCDPAEVEVAVVGLRLDSEHEDTCCATVELRGGAAAAALADEQQAAADFLASAKKAVGAGDISKGSKPDRVRFAPIPKNFKGAVLTPDMVKAWKELSGMPQ